MVRNGNLFADLPAQSEAELTTILAEEPGARVERIVSTGQASPAGFWYDQDGTEWVILLQGAAHLLIEGEEAPRTLQPGDFVEIPAHVRHRVEWTDTTGRLSGLPFTGAVEGRNLTRERVRGRGSRIHRPATDTLAACPSLGRPRRIKSSVGCLTPARRAIGRLLNPGEAP